MLTSLCVSDCVTLKYQQACMYFYTTLKLSWWIPTITIFLKKYKTTGTAIQQKYEKG